MLLSCSVVSDSLCAHGLSLPGSFLHGISRTSCLAWQVDSLPQSRPRTSPHVLASHIKQGPGITVCSPWYAMLLTVCGRSSHDFSCPLMPLFCPGSAWNPTYIQSPPLPPPSPTASLLPSGTAPQSVCHSLDSCGEYWHWLLRKSLTSDLILSHDKIWGLHFGQESHKSAALPCHVACDVGISCFWCWLESQVKVTSAWLPAKILSSFLGSISIFRRESSEYPIYYTCIY